MKKISIGLLFAVSALFASGVFAEIKMPKIFGDNMVFQAGKPVKVWGSAEPNAEVSVKFGKYEKSATASGDGSWSVKLPSMRPDKNPKELLVFENGKESKKIANVLVGEVWVLGGQSNMEWKLIPTTDGEAAAKRADYPILRCFQQDGRSMAETPQKDFPDGAKWVVCTPKTAPSFSGVGFYFAEKLMKDLDVPVAVIYTPLGATSMACWIPEKNMSDCDALKKQFDKFKKESAGYDYKKALDAHNKKIADFDAKVAKAKAEGKKVPSVPWDFRIPPNKFSTWKFFWIPAYHYNAKVAPLDGFAVRGVLWYQGESDSTIWMLDNFQRQFEILIGAWRELLGDEDLPFLFVQLASYGTRADWAETRWAQYNTARDMENVFMANIIDLGEEKDIHPKNKTDVGLRLEKIAMRKVYGESDAKAFAPTMKNVEYSNAVAVVDFDCDDAEIEGRGNPRGFEVLVNGEWLKPSGAKIENGKVVLYSPNAYSIDGVRYLWKSWAQPDVWIFDSNGLPAVSFKHLKKWEYKNL